LPRRVAANNGEPGQLTDPQAGIEGERHDERPPRVHRHLDAMDLSGGEEPTLTVVDSGKGELAEWVLVDQLDVAGPLHAPRGDLDRPVDGGWGEPGIHHVMHPRCCVSSGDLVDPLCPKPRLDVVPIDRLVTDGGVVTPAGELCLVDLLPQFVEGLPVCVDRPRSVTAGQLLAALGDSFREGLERGREISATHPNARLPATTMTPYPSGTGHRQILCGCLPARPDPMDRPGRPEAEFGSCFPADDLPRPPLPLAGLDKSWPNLPGFLGKTPSDLEPPVGIEPTTPALPWLCSAD